MRRKVVKQRGSEAAKQQSIGGLYRNQYPQHTFMPWSGWNLRPVDGPNEAPLVCEERPRQEDVVIAKKWTPLSAHGLMLIRGRKQVT